jgi:hypothetical protein
VEESVDENVENPPMILLPRGYGFDQFGPRKTTFHKSSFASPKKKFEITNFSEIGSRFLYAARRFGKNQTRKKKEKAGPAGLLFFNSLFAVA